MDTTRLDLSAAATVISLAILNTLSMYRDAAPKLADLRHAVPGDHTTKQLLLDADIFGGMVVVLVGGTAALLTRRMLPLVLSASGLLLVSLYYRSVANSTDPATVAGPDNKGE